MSRRFRHALVILSFDHIELTTKCIEAAQKFSVPIVLFHNGSTQKNFEFLRAKFPSVEHARCEANGGFTAGINQAFDFAFQNYEVLLFLTNDCEIQSLPRSWNFQVLVPKIIFPNGKIDAHGGFFYPERAQLRHNKQIPFTASLQNNLPLQNKSPAKDSSVRFYVPGAAFGIAKEFWDSYPHFDESLHTYWEDVDWSQEIPFAAVTFDPEVIIVHKGKRTTRRNSFYSLYLFQRNRKIVSRRYIAPFNRWPLEARLFWSWLALLLKLISQFRFADLRLHCRAYWSND